MEGPESTLSPFGHADGAREDFANLVVFPDGSKWGALATKPSDPSARIVIGRKGSGKTYFLRRIRDEALLGQSGSFVTDIQEDPPSTELVMEFSGRYNGASAVIAKWTKLWVISILSSVLSHASRNPALSRRLDEHMVDTIEKECSDLFATSQRRPTEACEQLQHFLATKRRRIDTLLTSNVGNDLKYRVATVLRKAPPSYIFIDGMDNFFDSAPHQWLLCQRGLLEAVRELLPHPGFGGRLHVTVALRDVVWSDTKGRSEHSSRLIDETYTRVLEWSSAAAKFFLDKKVQLLARQGMDGQAGAATTVEQWLGIKTIRNLRFGVDERVSDYLLRHTRLLPRDIVVMGNNLHQRLAVVPRDNQEAVEAVVRDSVAYCARLFGVEQIYICATELVAGLVPEQLGKIEDYSAFLDIPDLTRDVADRIRGFLRANITGIRMSKESFQQLTEHWREFTTKHYAIQTVDLQQLLWRNRMLGYRARRAAQMTDTFFSDREIGAEMPDADHYVFHPVLTDALDLEANGDGPVVPDAS